MIKTLKTKKGRIQFFLIALAVYIVCGTIPVFADNSGTYSGVPKEVLDMVDKKTLLGNFLRNIGWKILTFLADIADSIDETIKKLLKLNFYDYLSDAFNLSSMWTLIIALLSVAMIIGVMIMVIYHDKIHVSDFLMNLMVSCILLIALPSFISACNTLKTRGVKTAQEVEMQDGYNDTVVDKDGVVYKSTLGSDLLGQGVYDVYNSVLNKKRTTFTEAAGTSAIINSVNINQIISQDAEQPWTMYEITNSSEQKPAQKKYSELTTENMMELLGLSAEYSLLDSDDKFIVIADYSSNNGDVSYDVHAGGDYPYGYALTDEDYDVISSAQLGSAAPTSVRIGDLYFADGSRYERVTSYERYVIDLIANSEPVRNAGLTQTVGSSAGTVEDALELIKSTVIKELNIKSNENISVSHDAYAGVGYGDKKLMTEEDYDDLNKVAQWAEISFVTGSYEENLYYYHIDFLYTLFLLLAVCLCLLFAAFRIGTTLFEIMFNQLIMPFIIATDLHGSGRTKKAIQNFLLSNVILMIVVLMLRLYISVIWGVRESKYGDSFALMLIVIVSGAKFVIDGPEILTKLFGIDAGTKSIAGTMMSVNQAMQMGGYAASGMTHIAKHAASGASGAVKGFAGGIYGGINGGDTVPGKIGRSIGGASTGAIVGAVGGAFGHTDAGAKAGYAAANPGTIPGAIKNSLANEKDKIVSGIRESVGEGFSAGSSGNAARGADGANGVNGMNGAKGDRGVQGATGKDGSDGNERIETGSGFNAPKDISQAGTVEKGSGFDKGSSEGGGSSASCEIASVDILSSTENPVSGKGFDVPTDASQNGSAVKGAPSGSDFGSADRKSNNKNAGKGFKKED